MKQRRRYVRFASDRCNADSGVHEGLFCTAYRFRTTGGLDERQTERLEGLLNWFNLNLREPTCFT